jgi:flotillin
METPMLALLTVLALLFVMNALSALIIVCEPNEVVVLSGYGGKDQLTGERTGYRVLQAGWRLRFPFFERADRLDMRLMPIDITVENAYSEGSIPLTIRAIANVKLASDKKLIGNAMERFLGMPRSEIEQVARQTLEGNLRTVLASMTPEDVNQDRLTFSQRIQEEVGEDLSKLGLVVDTLKIQNVSDSVDYLASISRAAVARVQREASVAESNAEQTVGSAVAQAQANIGVAEQTAAQAIKRKQNELGALKAELDGRVAAEIERTEAAGRQARAKAQKKLQEIRATLEELRLEAEVVLPAKAREEAEQLKAEGASALIAERGAATADAFGMLTKAWAQGGNAARDIFLLQKLENVLEQVVGKVGNVRARSVNLVDTEGGGALAGYVSNYPAMVSSILGEFRESLGVDFAAALSGHRSDGGGEVIYQDTAEATPEDATTVAAGETSAEELLGLLGREVARVGKLGDKQERFLRRAGKLLGLGDDDANRIIAEAVNAEPQRTGPTPSAASLYGQAIGLAMRDGEVSADERRLLNALGDALGIRPDDRTEIEKATGLVPDQA